MGKNILPILFKRSLYGLIGLKYRNIPLTGAIPRIIEINKIYLIKVALASLWDMVQTKRKIKERGEKTFIGSFSRNGANFLPSLDSKSFLNFKLIVMKKQISATVVANVQSYLDKIAQVPADKASRILAKSYARDAKLNRFLTAKFEQGLALFTDKQRREKLLNEIDEGYGITSMEEKQALVLKVLTGEVDAIIEEKRLEVTAKDTLVLNDEQKNALSSKLIEYRKFWINKMLPGAMELANSLAVLEDVNETVNEPAQVTE